MLCYWILRRPDGKPVGLVKAQNDRAVLQLSAPVEGVFTLFSANGAAPIVPGTETELSGAEALLGTDGDRVTCFAAAESAAPMSVYRNRMYRFRTIQAKETRSAADPADHGPILSHAEQKTARPDAEPAQQVDSMSHNSTILTDDVSDSAQKVRAFSVLLERAGAFFDAYEEKTADNMVHNKDSTVEKSAGIDLFSQEYPGARWRYVEGTDVLPHYEGTWTQPNGTTLHILAVRGHAAPRPPRALLGFTRFLRDRDGTGYWLRLTPLG